MMSPRIHRPFVRCLCILLAGCLLVAAGAPARAQANVSATVSGNVTTGDDDDDATTDAIVVGMFIVVLGVLFIVGTKMDLEWWGKKTEPDANQYAMLRKTDDLDVLVAHPAPPAREWEPTGDLPSATWEMTF